jgi:Subtilase family
MGAVAPLPASDYQTHPACSEPAPDHASCLALELIPRTSEARARTHPLGMTREGPIKADRASEGADGLRPLDLRAAYFPGEPPKATKAAPQTIALVDAYNDPEAETDLAVYDREFGIEECTEANGCFEKVNQAGERGHPPFPASEAEREAELKVCDNTRETRARREACERVAEAEGWAVEISTDIETAHAICQQHCHILLVEADASSYTDLEDAEETAVKIGAEKTTADDTEVSNSWGGPEPLIESEAFNHPYTVITAAAGDDGYLNWTDAAGAEEEYYVGAGYPASSPHVIAVGGTRLTLGSGAWESESVWNDDPRGGSENYGAGGSGCSTQFEAAAWQRAVPDWSQVGCENRRAVADVSADGDPYSGIAIYDSVPDPHEELVGGKVETIDTPLYWWPIGGTSVASPIIASMFALAGGGHGVAYPAQTLYEHLETGLLHPVTAGGNGECDDDYISCSGSMNPLSERFAFDCGEGVLICNAGPGYDGPTGVGTPDGVGALEPGSEAEIKQKAEEEAPVRAEEEAVERQAREQAAAEAEERAAVAEREANEREARERAAIEVAEAEKAIEEAKRIEAERSAAKKIEEEKAATQNKAAGTSTNQPATVASSGSQRASTGDSTHSQSRASSGAASGHSAVRLSHLALTARASAVLAHGSPTVAQVAFAFTLSAPARVRVTLSRRVRVDGRLRWVSAPGTLALTAARGRDRDHLHGRGTLLAGYYRLTLTPAHGAARSLQFLLR